MQENGVDRLTVDELEAAIRSQAGHLAAATCAWLELIGEFERRGGWAQWGIKSCAHWVAWACSVSPATAREHVRIARALPLMPLVRAEFSAGRLSYSKVRAITRVIALVDEERLLNLARVETSAQLERTVRGFRKVRGVGLAQQRKRRARHYWDEDGMLVLSARLTAEEGAVVVAALRARQESVPPDAVLAESVEAERNDIDPAALSVADALVAVAQGSLAAAARLDESGDDRTLVVVHVNADNVPQSGQHHEQAELLSQEPEQVGVTATSQGRAQVEGGPGLDDASITRMACDSVVVALIKGSDRTALGSGRKTRKISPKLRRALRVRDEQCRYPACHRRSHLEAHHLRHWLHGGPTEMDNLALLCRFHHMLLHEGGFTVATGIDETGDLTLTFLRTNGQQVENSPALRPSSKYRLTTNPDIQPHTIAPEWLGEPFSLAEAVSALVA